MESIDLTSGRGEGRGEGADGEEGEEGGGTRAGFWKLQLDTVAATANHWNESLYDEDFSSDTVRFDFEKLPNRALCNEDSWSSGSNGSSDESTYYNLNEYGAYNECSAFNVFGSCNEYSGSYSASGSSGTPFSACAPHGGACGVHVAEVEGDLRAEAGRQLQEQLLADLLDGRQGALGGKQGAWGEVYLGAVVLVGAVLGGVVVGVRLGSEAAASAAAPEGASAGAAASVEARATASGTASGSSPAGTPTPSPPPPPPPLQHTDVVRVLGLAAAASNCLPRQPSWQGGASPFQRQPSIGFRNKIGALFLGDERGGRRGRCGGGGRHGGSVEAVEEAWDDRLGRLVLVVVGGAGGAGGELASSASVSAAGFFGPTRLTELAELALVRSILHAPPSTTAGRTSLAPTPPNTSPHGPSNAPTNAPTTNQSTSYSHRLRQLDSLLTTHALGPGILALVLAGEVAELPHLTQEDLWL
ncbi:unnamed protein product [Closterium sp. NIES-65]|nr:unnamed protein product [Closterium sp. NIES-65]